MLFASKAGESQQCGINHRGGGVCEVMLEEHNWFAEDAKNPCTILKAILFLMTFL